MKNTKKLFLFALAVTLFAVVFCFSASALDDGGYCGDNLTWSYNSTTKELIISGTGEMGDYTCFETPWDKYYDSTKTIIIKDGVESICDYAFVCFTNLEKVKIGNDLKEISQYSFEECEKLKEVYIGNKVSVISRGAFNSCVSIENIDIPDSVEVIGNDAFGMCENLKNIKLGKNVNSIGEKSFYECISLSSINIPNSVKTIKNNAFGYCQGIESIVIGNGVENIGDYAFGYCTFLKTVTLPKSIKSIGDSAFYFCKSLETVNYCGTKNQWKQISIGTANSYLTKANILYNTNLDKKLSKVKNLKANKKTSDSITLNWKKVTGAKKYVIYKYTKSTDKYKKVGVTSKTEYTVKNLKSNQTYRFSVRAYKKINGKGNYSDYSSIVTAKTSGKVNLKVSGLKITNENKAENIKLSWNKQVNISGIEILRSESGKKGSYKKIATVGSNATTYRDKKVKNAKVYYYALRTYKNKGQKKQYGDLVKIYGSTKLTNAYLVKKFNNAFKFCSEWYAIGNMYADENDRIDYYDEYGYPNKFYCAIKHNKIKNKKDLKKVFDKYFASDFSKKMIDEHYIEKNGKLYAEIIFGGDCQFTSLKNTKAKIIKQTDKKCIVKITEAVCGMFDEVNYRQHTFTLVLENGAWVFEEASYWCVGIWAYQ